MRREEKRRKFHEAVVNTLYPPPSSPPQAEGEEKNSAYTSDKNFQVELIDPDDFLRRSNSNTSSDDGDNGNGGEIESQKLTRAQRKRLRKKKLKEDIARRRGIVGPLLPGKNNCDDNENSDGIEEDSESVRQNASEKCGGAFDIPREQLGCNNQNKIKQRRRAKKMARDELKISSTENYDQDQSLKPNNNDEICDPDQNIKSGLLK